MPRFTIKLADSRLNLGAFYDLEKPLPFMVRLVSHTGGQSSFFKINDPQAGSELSDDKNIPVAIFRTPELSEGLYRLEIYSPFANRPLIVQDNLRLGPQGSTFKFSLPDSEIDTDDPKLQANTVAMDVLADAPYCLRKGADGKFPDLPILILVKDIPDHGVTINNVNLLYIKEGKKGEFRPDLVKNPIQCPFELKPAFGPPDSGLGETPSSFLFYIDTERLCQQVPEYLSRGGYSGYSEANFLEFEVEIKYQGMLWIHHSSKTVLRTLFLNALPHFEDWYYGDTHYHSIYTENLAEFGGPLVPTLEVARVVGLDWLFLTDHSWDFTRDKKMHSLKPEEKWVKFLDWVSNISTQQGSDSVLMVPAEEITVSNKAIHSVLGLHMLSYEAGPEGLVQDHYFVGESTLSEVLEKLESIKSPGAKPLVFAAHPASPGNTWGDDECADIKKSPLFGGLQVFNERVTCERKVFGIDVHEYDLLFDKSTPEDPYKQLGQALTIWREQFLLPAVRESTNDRKVITPCPILGGSDAHMDFNFALRPNPIYVYLMFTDNAFGKVRTLAYIPGFKKAAEYKQRKELLLKALKQGLCVATDGPVVIPTLVITHQDNSVIRLVCGIREDKDSSFYCLQEGDSFRLEYEVDTPEESQGVKTELRLFYPQKVGDELREIPRGDAPFIIHPDGHRHQGSIPLDDILQGLQGTLRAAYFRIECNTVNEMGEIIGYCCTNPIWITWE